MKTALVTGISSDMGQALKKLLEQNDWQIIGPTHAEVDLADLDAVAAYAHGLRATAPQIDAVVHFAGVWHDQSRALTGMKLSEFQPQQIIEAMNVGLTSLMVLLSQLLVHLPHNASVVGVSGKFSWGGAGMLPYFVSKRGLEDLLVSLADEQKGKIRVYGVSPDDTATIPFVRYYPEDARGTQSPETVAQFIQKLLENQTSYSSGDIILLKQGEDSRGFHV